MLMNEFGPRGNEGVNQRERRRRASLQRNMAAQFTRQRVEDVVVKLYDLAMTGDISAIRLFLQYLRELQLQAPLSWRPPHVDLSRAVRELERRKDPAARKVLENLRNLGEGKPPAQKPPAKAG
jgi:hypothetical protein